MKLDPPHNYGGGYTPTAYFLIRVSTYSNILSRALFPIDNGNYLDHPTILKKLTTNIEKKILTGAIRCFFRILFVFIFCKCIQKHTEHDLLVCGDKFSPQTIVYEL